MAKSERRSGRVPICPAGYAANDCARQKHTYAARGDERCEFEVDRARILHSAAFRRLSGKTQVFAIGQSDFFRTRLTHSLEVAQISKGIALRTGVANPELCEAAALAHDIGHPPFGHKGEQVLSELMQSAGGFEANAQNFRVLCELEVKFADFRGLDLARGTLDALFKYKVPFDPSRRKFYYAEDQALVDWIGNSSEPQSLECQIMEFADDVAYAVHDLEDGVHAEMVTPIRVTRHGEQILTAARQKEPSVTETDLSWALANVVRMTGKASNTDAERKAARKQTTSNLIGDAIRAVKAEHRSGSPESIRYAWRIRVDPKVRRGIEVLKHTNYVLLVDDARVQTLEARAQRILEELLGFFSRSDALRSYPDDFREAFRTAQREEDRARVACDYIAGMTDQYAERMHQRLFSAGRAALHDY